MPRASRCGDRLVRVIAKSALCLVSGVEKNYVRIWRRPSARANFHLVLSRESDRSAEISRLTVAAVQRLAPDSGSTRVSRHSAALTKNTIMYEMGDARVIKLRQTGVQCREKIQNTCGVGVLRTQGDVFTRLNGSGTDIAPAGLNRSRESRTEEKW